MSRQTHTYTHTDNCMHLDRCNISFVLLWNGQTHSPNSPNIPKLHHFSLSVPAPIPPSLLFLHGAAKDYFRTQMKTSQSVNSRIYLLYSQDKHVTRAWYRAQSFICSIKRSHSKDQREHPIEIRCWSICFVQNFQWFIPFSVSWLSLWLYSILIDGVARPETAQAR